MLYISGISLVLGALAPKTKFCVGGKKEGNREKRGHAWNGIDDLYLGL
jgi:hypothetical protein